MPEQSLKEKNRQRTSVGCDQQRSSANSCSCFWHYFRAIAFSIRIRYVGMLTIFTLIGNSLQESGFRAALVNLKEIRHEDYNAVFWCSTFIGIAAYLIFILLCPVNSSLLRRAGNCYHYPVIAFSPYR